MNKAVRKAIIAGNWKMNKTRPEAKALIEAIKPLVANAEGKIEVITDAVSTKVAKVREKKQDVITRVLQYEHTPIITAAAIGFLTGVIVGFMAAPIKKGVTIGCNNRAVNNEFDDDFEYDDIEDYEEDE